MTRRSAAGLVVFLLAGSACLASLPLLLNRTLEAYRLSEPFYRAPIETPSNSIHLRSDRYGKGYFGASRNKGRKHKGLDVSAPVGTPVLAVKSGRVRKAEWDKGYGNWVEIVHPDGLASRYAHLSEVGVQPGQWVQKGRPIGRCGKTGNAVNPHIFPHVHFEIRAQGEAVNPTHGLLDPSLRILSSKR